jgi:molybdopterin synthase sulfur carrier subunit
MAVKILYFAWVREKIGKAEELVELPEGVDTVAGLIGWLSRRDARCAEAFASPGVIRAAVDRKHASGDARLAGAREIAFFPPVTGG